MFFFILFFSCSPVNDLHACMNIIAVMKVSEHKAGTRRVKCESAVPPRTVRAVLGLTGQIRLIIRRTFFVDETV